MRGLVSQIEIHTPKNFKSALEFLSRENGSDRHWKILAGATDVAVEFNAGKLAHGQLINIWGLRKELAGIKARKDQLVIGALTTFTEIQEHPLVQKHFPALAEAARLVGGVQIQNRGTIGGNIANASPAGDSLPPLLAYDGVLQVQSSKGIRAVPMARFYRGYKDLDLAPDEMIASVTLPVPKKGCSHFFRKVGTRQAQAISKVVAAGLACSTGGTVRFLSFALGSVGPSPLRCGQVEKFLIGKKTKEVLSQINEAREILGRDISPRDDIRSTREYRHFVSRSLLEQFLKSI